MAEIWVNCIWGVSVLLFFVVVFLWSQSVAEIRANCIRFPCRNLWQR